jgi:D-alanyl-D-alanine carboxypeptidase
MKYYLLSLLLFLTLTSNLEAQDFNKDALKIKLKAKIDEIFVDSLEVGVTFGYSLPNGNTHAVAGGWADKQKNERMNPYSRMLGGSTGKVFYSVVLMQLVEEGKIKLDTKISTYLGQKNWFERIPNAETLTVRNLMRHSTGIPRYVFSEKFQIDVLVDIDKVWKPEELVSYVYDDEPLFEAGADFAYSDTNYIILCMIIEEVTGNDLYKEVNKRVLKKAGLKYVSPQTKRKYKGLVQGYNGDEDPFFPGNALDTNGKSRYNWQFEWAGGGLVINSYDLAKLGKLVYEGKMFSPELLEEYFDGRDAGRMGGTWGLGVHIRETSSGLTYGHRGFMPGYSTNMVYYKDQEFSVCIQLNSTKSDTRPVRRVFPELVSIIKEDLAKLR